MTSTTVLPLVSFNGHQLTMCGGWLAQLCTVTIVAAVAVLQPSFAVTVYVVDVAGHTLTLAPDRLPGCHVNVGVQSWQLDTAVKVEQLPAVIVDGEAEAVTENGGGVISVNETLSTKQPWRGVV